MPALSRQSDVIDRIHRQHRRPGGDHGALAPADLVTTVTITADHRRPDSRLATVTMGSIGPSRPAMRWSAVAARQHLGGTVGWWCHPNPVTGIVAVIIPYVPASAFQSRS